MLIKIVKRNSLLSFLSLLAVLSSYWLPPKLSYIDWHVVALLFNLMVVVVALQHYKLLDFIALRLLMRCNSERRIGRIMLGLCFVIAMLVTNDVALISFVPLTLLLSYKVAINPVRMVVLETLAANLGSSFTPLGNPQNLFLFAYYHYSLSQFLATTLILVLLGAGFLWSLSYKFSSEQLAVDVKPANLVNGQQIILFSGLFGLILLSIAQLFDYRYVTLIVIVVTLISAPAILRQVDYGLLLTFIAFFILIGNLAHWAVVASFLQQLLAGKLMTFCLALGLSQLISNVPSSILLAPFTAAQTELVWGVNVGGMGTLIASMASVISYRLFIRAYPTQNGAFLKMFTGYNLLGLVLFALVLLPYLYWWS